MGELTIAYCCEGCKHIIEAQKLQVRRCEIRARTKAGSISNVNSRTANSYIFIRKVLPFEVSRLSRVKNYLSLLLAKCK
jgi:hypothetical protein